MRTSTGIGQKKVPVQAQIPKFVFGIQMAALSFWVVAFVRMHPC